VTAIIVMAASLVIGGLVGLAVRRWLVLPVRVESSSMEPTLRPGRRILVRRLRRAERVARGDLVLVRSEEVGRAVVKRAVGLSGEVIHLDDLGRACVDGNRLVEPHGRRTAGPATTFVVPDGSLFLLGDNRQASSDSRSWRQPYLPEHAVVGKVLGALGGTR
jgi:signal peptidase I